MITDFAGNDTPLLNRMERIQRIALIVGAAAVLVSIGGVVVNRDQFFRSYLYAYVFWFNVSMGCLALLMLHHMVTSRWGFVVQRVLESGARTFPLMAVLFIPILFGLSTLYPWERHVPDPAEWGVLHVNNRENYLNVPFFTIRAVVFFAVWTALAMMLSRWSRLQDQTGDPALASRMKRLSAPGLVIYVLTATFASIDWIMSLRPEWTSSIYGFIVVVSQVLAALALATVLLAFLSKAKPLSEVVTARSFHQLGNLLLTFVILWAYTAYAQWLITWAGNIPDEISWYLARVAPGWKSIALLMIVFHFFAPFLLLLSRRVKRTVGYIAILAIGLLTVRLVDLFWFITPAFYPERFHIDWLDAVLPVAIGGIWVWVFIWQLKTAPLLPRHDPRFEVVPAHRLAISGPVTAEQGEA